MKAAARACQVFRAMNFLHSASSPVALRDVSADTRRRNIFLPERERCIRGRHSGL
jgi:hypothetical protein